MFKRKRYNLILRVRMDEKNISDVKYFGLKKVIYKYDMNKGTVKATLIHNDGKKSIVEHVNVIDVEKQEV